MLEMTSTPQECGITKTFNDAADRRTSATTSSDGRSPLSAIKKAVASTIAYFAPTQNRGVRGRNAGVSDGVLFPEVEWGTDRRATRAYAQATAEAEFTHVLAYDYDQSTDRPIDDGFSGRSDVPAGFRGSFALYC
jgi:hypothetical protein